MQRRRATGVGPKCENTFTYVTFSFTFTTMNYQLLIPRPRRPCLACWHPLLATCSRTGTLVFAASRPQVCSVHTARNANEQHEILQRLISMAPAPPRPQPTVSPTLRPLLAACHHGAALQVEVRAFRRDPRDPPTSSDEIGPRGELAAGKSVLWRGRSRAEPDAESEPPRQLRRWQAAGCGWCLVGYSLCREWRGALRWARQ
jgi:hypothetical protein